MFLFELNQNFKLAYLLLNLVTFRISWIISCFLFSLRVAIALLKQLLRCPSINIWCADFRSPMTAKFCCIISIQYSLSSAILTIFAIELCAFLKLIKVFSLELCMDLKFKFSDTYTIGTGILTKSKNPVNLLLSTAVLN